MSARPPPAPQFQQCYFCTTQISVLEGGVSLCHDCIEQTLALPVGERARLYLELRNVINQTNYSRQICHALFEIADACNTIKEAADQIRDDRQQ